MSYILDALRKSDQQRQHGATPTLASVQFSAAETRQRRHAWLVGVAGVLFVAGILIGWWRPWQEPQPSSVHQPAAAAAQPAASVAVAQQPPPPAVLLPPSAATLPERAPPSAPPKPAFAPPALPAADAAQTPSPVAGAPIAASAVTAATVPTAATAATAATQDDTRADKARRGAGRPADPPTAEKRAGTEAQTAATEQKVMSRAELPGSIQQELPRFSVSLHAYSKTPGNRLVSVNDQLLHEGDALSPGLVLEQIRPDDMVFSYKGFRFRQGLQ